MSNREMEQMVTQEGSKVLHEPKLDTFLMVERALKEARDYPIRMGLWKALPRKIQYQTFKRILEYLEASNKIRFDGKNIIWCAVDNQKLKNLLETAVKVR